MKKYLLKISLFFLFLAGIGMFSCKRCATCTFDDAAYGGQDTSDFCGNGNSYKDMLEQHEKNGWKCVEN